MDIQPTVDQKAARWTALSLAVAGAGLLAASWTGIFPMVSLAHAMSSDGSLTETFVTLLQRSQWILAMILVLIAPALPSAARLYDNARSRLLAPSDRAFAIMLGLCSFAAALTIQSVVFNGIPHVTDAVSHWFQAKIFCLGKLYVPLPACLDHFAQHNIVMSFDGKWHTKYFPGQALWLALGMKGGATWLMMPLAFAVCAVSLVRVCWSIFDRLFARICGILFVASPMCLLLGGSFMSHITFLMFALSGLAAMTCLCDGPERPGHRAWYALPGFLFGMALLTRPQDFLLLILFLVMAFVALPAEIRRRLARGILPALLGFALPVAFLFFWNHFLYGRWFASGYSFNNSPSLGLVKHDSIGFSAGYTFASAVDNMVWTALRFNKALLGWPTSLLFIPLAFLLRPPDRRMWICAAMIVACIGLYFFFPYYGFEYEARYYTAAVPFAIALTVMGLRNSLRPVTRAIVLAVLMASFLHALAYYWPSCIWPAYSGSYEQVSPVLQQSAQRDGLQNAVVLVRSSGEDEFRYSCGFLYNDPLLHGNVIYARDLGEENECIFAAFGGRRFFRFVPSPGWSDGFFEPVR